MATPPKYPRTPHWPWSETIHADDKTHQTPKWFEGKTVVITEKMDGGNVCLFNGEVYARSVATPSRNAWLGMVRKHHAHKTMAPEYKDLALYGEDIFGVHSIEYNPVREDETFMLFAARDGDRFLSFGELVSLSKELNIAMVPIAFIGTMASTDAITSFFKEYMDVSFGTGPEKEGFVMRDACGFQAQEFEKRVCKYVRKNHVQTDEHWTRNWKPCEIKKG